MDEIRIRKPDDFHLHLRQGENLGEYVRQSSRCFERALIMPNILPPVCDVASLLQYKKSILAEVENFKPLMTFKILPDMKAADIKPLKEAGAVAGKLYPAGATTNAEDGVKSLDQISDVLSAMEEEGLVLSIHGENPEAPILERERAYLPELSRIASSFGSLKVILEHLSNRESLEYLNDLPETFAGTITVHHLLFTLDDLMGGSLKTHLFCKPVVKSEQDRKALADAVLDENPRLFFGSDSAPHGKSHKENGTASAGVFTSPVALPLLADFFDREGCLDCLEGFVSTRGAEFYDLPFNRGNITLKRDAWTVPEIIGGAVPLLAGQELAWRVLS